MAIDWKSRMLEATASAGSRPSAQLVQHVVEAALHSGARLDDVQQFAAQQPALAAVSALFADGFGDVGGLSRKTPATLGGDVRSPRSSSFGAGAGFRLHAVRVDPRAALPWFHKVAAPLPAPLMGEGRDIVIDGERFTAHDVAALLRAA